MDYALLIIKHQRFVTFEPLNVTFEPLNVTLFSQNVTFEKRRTRALPPALPWLFLDYSII